MKLGWVKRLDDMQNLAFGDTGVPVKCDPVNVVLKDDAEPWACSISLAKRMPLPLLSKAERELEHMLLDGIIKKVT